MPPFSSRRSRDAFRSVRPEVSYALPHTPALCTGGRELVELGAESVAYVVCEGLGLDSSASSFGCPEGWWAAGSRPSAGSPPVSSASAIRRNRS
jgi:hypothetical protein